MANTKPATKPQPNPFTYPKALGAGQTHVGVIRSLLSRGATTDQVKDAYATARFPEFAARPAHKTKDEKTLKSFLRKHADTHIKLARVDMAPEVQAERLTKVQASVARTEDRLKAQRAKLGALSPAASA